VGDLGTDGTDNVVKPVGSEQIGVVIGLEGCGHLTVIEPHGNGVDRPLWELL
jgi:hypothetical protein